MTISTSLTKDTENFKFSLSDAGSILKWAGGKTQLLPDIRNNCPKLLLDNNIDTYIEPFIGSGAVFFDLATKFTFKNSFLFDVNPELIILYNAIKSKLETLIDVLSNLEKIYLLKSEEERKDFFYEVREKYNLLQPESLARLKSNEVDVERAALTIFLNRTCFNGLFRVNSKSHFNVPFGKYKSPTILFEKRLRASSYLLQNATIKLVDFSETEDCIEGNTFVYYDPPYRPISQTSSFTSYSKDTFDDDEQRRLFAMYQRLDSRNVLQLLSNSDPKNYNKDDTFFDDLYSDFKILRVNAKRMINSNSDKRGNISELLIKNYSDG